MRIVFLMVLLFSMSAAATQLKIVNSSSSGGMAECIRVNYAIDINSTKYAQLSQSKRDEMSIRCRRETKSNEKNSCDATYESYTEARKEAGEKCAGYGMGGSLTSCDQKILKCSPDTTAEGSSSSISTILGALGMPSLSQTNKSCPQFTSEVLDERLEQIEENLQKSKEKVADIQKQIQEAQSTASQATAEAQKVQAEREYETSTGQVDYQAKQREIAAEAVKHQHDIERQIDRAHDRMLAAQSELTRAIQEKTRQLLSLKRSCDDALESKRAEIKAEIAAFNNSDRLLSGGLNANANFRKQKERELKIFYSRCLKRVQKDRVLVINASNAQTKIARQKMRRAQNEMDRLQDEINVQRSRSQHEIAEMRTRSELMVNNTRKAVETAFNTAQLAHTKATTLQNTLTQQISTEQMNTMMNQVQLSSLKAGKPKYEITENPNTVRSALTEWKTRTQGFINSCCPRLKRSLAGSGSTTSRLVNSRKKADHSLTGDHSGCGDFRASSEFYQNLMEEDDGSGVN